MVRKLTFFIIGALIGVTLLTVVFAAMVYMDIYHSKRPNLPWLAKIEESVLFPNNDRILTTYCPKGLPDKRKCHLAAWDLDGGNLEVFWKPRHHSWRRPRFSPDGKEFVFEIYDSDKFVSKLAILNVGTKHWRVVEDSATHKVDVSYHPNGQKLIFVVAAKTPDTPGSRPGSRLSAFDVHNLDLRTGETLALTRYKFGQVARPYFTGRRDGFVFGGYGPWKILRDPKNAETEKTYHELYEGNAIITINEDKTGWRPDFVMYEDAKSYPRAYSGSAVPSKNGEIMYFASNKGNLAELENSSLSAAIWERKDNFNRRVFYFNSVTGYKSNYSNFTLSSDEEYFLISSGGYPAGISTADEGLWRVKVNGSEPRRIPILWKRLESITATTMGP